MVINEKAMVKAMTKCFKGGGYTVACGKDGKVWLLGTDWEAWCKIEHLPRKVLGLLVEHLGKIPQEGTAYHISDKMGCQSEMFETAVEDSELLAGRMAASGARILHTPLVLAGYRLWQQGDNLQLHMVSPELMSLIEPREGIRATAGWVGTCGDYSGIYIPAENDPKKENVLEHLAKIQYFGE